MEELDTSYHTNTDSDTDERKLESQLDSRQPNHLIDINGDIIILLRALYMIRNTLKETS